MGASRLIRFNIPIENWQKPITSKYDQCGRAAITFPSERFISQDKQTLNKNFVECFWMSPTSLSNLLALPTKARILCLDSL
jgi:hypothetical protein